LGPELALYLAELVQEHGLRFACVVGKVVEYDAPSKYGGTMSGTSNGLIKKPLPPDLFYDHGGNAEMRWEAMADQGYATPNDRFYIRNHGATPTIDVASWSLRVEGPGVSRDLSLSYEDLLTLPAVSVTRALECAGNGRVFFGEQEGREAEGTPWRLGAIGVAKWTGVPLRRLLEEAGLVSSAVEVMPEGLDEPRFDRPLSLSKALEEDVILAYLMNDEPLPPDHGYPARVIVPGWAAVASVKWVGRILVSDRPLLTHWNTEEYVLAGPGYEPREGARGPAVKETLVNSALELPWPAQLSEGRHMVTGRAWSGAGAIESVEYSIDRGGWRAARLREPNVAHAWVRFDFECDARPGEHSLRVRATDTLGNVQPESMPWNEEGYLYNAVVSHPVTVH
jgi:sulfane dehydrogenase subunit SoxC